jgi:hypothetical protein
MQEQLLKKSHIFLLKMCKEAGMQKYSGKNKKILVNMLLHNQSTKENKNEELELELVSDKEIYTEEKLKQQYNLHKRYAKERKATTVDEGLKVRQSNFPEDISENIVKYIIRNKLCITSTWNKKKGDLYSEEEGNQECKCFTSIGPMSFSPKKKWDILYCLDGQKWLENDIFILYRLDLSNSQWNNLYINKTETLEDQVTQKRRPRITFNMIRSQYPSHCTIIYKGTFDEIFITA